MPTARRDVAPLRRRQPARDAGVAGEHETERRVRVHLRLLTRHDRLDLIVLLVPRRHDVPPHAVVDRQVRLRAPAVLREHAAVLIAQIEHAARRLDVVARRADQEVREVGPGFGAGERERAVERRIRFEPDLLKLVLATELQRVRSQDPRHAVAQVQRVAGLVDAGDRHAHRERVEHEVLDAVELRREDDDARRARTGHKPLLTRASRPCRRAARRRCCALCVRLT